MALVGDNEEPNNGIQRRQLLSFGQREKSDVCHDAILPISHGLYMSSLPHGDIPLIHLLPAKLPKTTHKTAGNNWICS